MNKIEENWMRILKNKNKNKTKEFSSNCSKLPFNSNKI